MSRGTQVPARLPSPSTTGLSPPLAGRSRPVRLGSENAISQALQPRPYRYRRFGHRPRSLAATRRVTVLFSFPPGTEMFHFPGLAPPCLCVQQGVPIGSRQGWVIPFGDLRIKACERLPAAYRSCPRPSSPLIAKASAARPINLDHLPKTFHNGPPRHGPARASIRRLASSHPPAAYTEYALVGRSGRARRLNARIGTSK